MPEAASNQRIEERTSLFIMATLHFAASQVPVKLRNVSRTGALIEGADIPATGAKVEMRRGALSATGVVAWRDGPCGGLSFDTPTVVDGWLPTAPMQPAVDRTVARLRDASAVPQGNVATLHASFISTEDMENVANLLDDLGDTLSDDAAVLSSYGLKLQALDIAAQMLRKLAHQGRA